jgi:hypothetical protein|uniref:Uncharacterized protein n=1 Tax=Ignisphaera aggregans TaxID=334771 RepID=A0A7J2U6B3_9CREN
MVLEDNIVTKFQAYIIYSKSLKEILRRVINYMQGCNNIVSDAELKPEFEELCSDSKPQYMEFLNSDAVDKAVMQTEFNRAIVLKVSSPRSDVHAIALIPTNQRNKEAASKR